MLLKRKIYSSLLKWKEKEGKTALLVEGARRVGKSTIAEEFAKNEYKSYIIIDFSKCTSVVKNAFLEQMSHLEERNLDYAVLPMDFTYTMDVPETIRCAKLIAANHTIPVHMSPGKLFDMDRAKKLAVPGALIVKPGESIRL